MCVGREFGRGLVRPGEKLSHFASHIAGDDEEQGEITYLYFMKLTHRILILAAWLLAVPAQSLTAAPVEQAVLTEGAAAVDGYGSALALSGDTLVVGKFGGQVRWGRWRGLCVCAQRRHMDPAGGAHREQRLLG